MKKILLLLLGLLFIFSSTTFTAQAEENAEDALNENIEELLSSLDTSELEEYLASLENGAWENVPIKDRIIDLIQGGSLSYTDLFSAVLSYFKEILQNHISVFLVIVSICVFDGIIVSLKSNFLSDSVTNVVHYACFSGILTVLFTEIIPIIDLSKNTVNEISKQVDLFFPLLIMLMSGSGASVSAAVYRPAVAFLSNGVILLAKNIIFPVAILLIGLSVVGGISGKINLNGFVKFFQNSSKWLIGIVFTLYSVCLTVQGITTSTFDGLSLRAAKYAVSNGVPMIGGFLSGGMDLVLAGSILIKNSLGVIAILLLFFTIAEPLVEWIVFSLLLKLTCAVITPIADGRIAGFLDGLSQNIGYFIAGLLSVAFAFFITVMLLICSTGVIL